MSKRRYFTLDVFTATPLKGNPLAVVLDSDGLDTARMQAIAQEFNLSETVFVLPPSEPRHRARIRIFTPTIEMPFAGHPTLGTASLLTLLDEKGPQAFSLELNAGLVPCVMEPTGETTARGRFRSPGVPRVYEASLDPIATAAALGLDPKDIGFAHHGPSMHGVRLPMAFAPVARVAALAQIKPHAAQINRLNPEHQAIYAYAPDPENGPLAFRSRMFAPEVGVIEDPATGSAAAAFAGVLMQFEKLGDGEHNALLTQGVEMGRQSEIGVQLKIESGALTAVEISGAAVIMSEGTLRA
jgi:trans-2,3-dihydro-3-hydroxyanthranilate isomerase